MGCSLVLSPLSVLGAPLPAAGPVLLKQWEVAGVFPGSHILTRAALAHCASGLMSCLLGPAASQLPGQQCCLALVFPCSVPSSSAQSAAIPVKMGLLGIGDWS